MYTTQTLAGHEWDVNVNETQRGRAVVRFGRYDFGQRKVVEVHIDFNANNESYELAVVKLEKASYQRTVPLSHPALQPFVHKALELARQSFPPTDEFIQTVLDPS